MINNKIGDRIRELREKKGETQASVAKKIGVKRETVNQWENGTRDLKTEYTVKIADYFKTTCDYILRGIPAENVDIHRATGLKYNAIRNLTVGFQNFDNYKEIADKFIGHKKFPHLVNYIIVHTKKVNEFNSKGENIIFDIIKSFTEPHSDIAHIISDPETIINGSAYKINEVASEIVKDLISEETK